MAEIAVAIIDLNGCLIPDKGVKATDYFQGLEELSGLIEAANSGDHPKISFCTGRERAFVRGFSQVVGYPDFYSIIESGYGLFNPATERFVVNPNLTEEMIRKFKLACDEVVPLLLKKYPALSRYVGNEIAEALDLRDGGQITTDDCYKTARILLAKPIAKRLIHLTNTPQALDITPAVVNKETGMELFYKETGINPKKTVGIGDSKGDLPMFKKVHFVGCPSGATEECKEAVKARKGYVSDFDHVQGCLDVIRHFMKA